MANSVEGFTLPYTADADMGPWLIASFGSVDGNAKVATGATDKLLGVTYTVGTAAGQIVDVVHGGSPRVTFGGTVNAGDWLTSDANGNAVAIASGATANTIGRALESGVSGDIRPFLAQVGRVTAQ